MQSYRWGYNCIAIISIEFSEQVFGNILTVTTLSLDNLVNEFNQPTKMNLARQIHFYDCVHHIDHDGRSELQSQTLCFIFLIPSVWHVPGAEYVGYVVECLQMPKRMCI